LGRHVEEWGRRDGTCRWIEDSDPSTLFDHEDPPRSVGHGCDVEWCGEAVTHPRDAKAVGPSIGDGDGEVEGGAGRPVADRDLYQIYIAPAVIVKSARSAPPDKEKVSGSGSGSLAAAVYTTPLVFSATLTVAWEVKAGARLGCGPGTTPPPPPPPPPQALRMIVDRSTASEPPRLIAEPSRTLIADRTSS
jgi:hypothetical protein